MSPPSLGKFDVEGGLKLVAIVAMSDFTKDYLIKQKIIIYKYGKHCFLTGGALINALAFSGSNFCLAVYPKSQSIKSKKDMIKQLKICNELK